MILMMMMVIMERRVMRYDDDAEDADDAVAIMPRGEEIANCPQLRPMQYLSRLPP